MTPQDAQALQIAGRYSDLLRAAVDEQVRAHRDGRADDELRWSLWAARACRFLGRLYEGVGHAVHAALRARALGREDLIAEAAYVQALLIKAQRKPAEALALLDWASDRLPADAPPQTRAVYELERAEMAIEAGRLEEARESLARGAARVQALENPRLMAWALYLRSFYEGPAVAGGQLTGALSIAESLDCPELQWHILWRLAQCMSQLGHLDAEEDHLRRACAILQSLVAPLSPDDAASFWRSGARASFLDHVRTRFWPGFESESAVRADPPAPSDDILYDPQLMPAFVQESLRTGLPLAG